MSVVEIKLFLKSLPSLVRGFRYFLEFEKKGSPRKLNEDLQEEYIRLFAASAVPLLMRIFEGYKVQDSSMPEYYEHLRSNSGEGFYVSKPAMKQFRKVVKSRNFSVSKMLLWEKYSGKKEPSVLLDYLAKSSDRTEVLRWIQNNDLDSGMSMKYPDNINDWPGDLPSTMKSEVGFLFFSVKNLTDKPIRNIEIVFKKASIRERMPSIDWRPKTYSFSELETRFETKGSPDAYPLKDPVFHEEIPITFTVLEPGEQALFLIAIYRSDQDGFEDGYLDDTFKPWTLLNRSAPLPRPLFLRKPLRGRSARYFVPYGWLRQ